MDISAQDPRSGAAVEVNKMNLTAVCCQQWYVNEDGLITSKNNETLVLGAVMSRSMNVIKLKMSEKYGGDVLSFSFQKKKVKL